MSCRVPLPRRELNYLLAACAAAVVLSGLFAAESDRARDAAARPGQFTDITQKSGVAFLHRASKTARKYLLETMGGGVAVFDYDNDGRLDIYLVNGAPVDDPTPPGTIPKKTSAQYWNKLYHQRSDGTFEDVTQPAGVAGYRYGMGVAAADYDNDGFADLYVTEYGQNTLYRNNGDGTFTDVTAQAGVGGSGWSTSAAWVDYDQDGKLDLVVGRYMEWDFSDLWCGERREGQRAYCHPDLFKPETILLYHNEDGKRFREMSRQAGLTTPGKALGIAIGDYDRDGWIDIFVANDATPQFLFHNQKNGTFAEVALESEIAVDADGGTYSGMGVDFADYNNDGYPDVLVSTLANQKYALYENRRDGTFQYSSDMTGISAITVLHSGWGLRFFDFDNDGLKDILVAQSHVLDTIEATSPSLRYKETALLARNTGKRFVDVSKDSGPVFQQRIAARGIAAGDLDNDGRLDFVMTTLDGPAYVIRNETPSGNSWLSVRLRGGKSNREGIGALVRVTTPAGDQYQTVTTASSYQSSNDVRVHFGLGRIQMVPRLEIHWPGGVVQQLTNVRANQVLTVAEPNIAPGTK